MQNYFIENPYYSTDKNILWLLNIINIKEDTFFSLIYKWLETNEFDDLQYYRIRYDTKNNIYYLICITYDAIYYYSENLSEILEYIKEDIFNDKTNTDNYLKLIDKVLKEKFSIYYKNNEIKQKQIEEEREKIKKEEEREYEIIRKNKEKFKYLLEWYNEINYYFRKIFHFIKNSIYIVKEKSRGQDYIYKNKFKIEYIDNLDELYRIWDENIINIISKEYTITTEIIYEYNYTTWRYDKYNVSFSFNGHNYNEDHIMRATNNFVEKYEYVKIKCDL